ncbi:hypothetical protein DSLASN_22360 [Desulfoluna limicola]|uniref:Uncharacterized protein n=1 Tax=Desulfoluna limicola TaxID=2810562 RepID=A0ABM7PHK4_9BACT|nr:hypothetical protein DSLASN_22360 [Desulfoluna limicola]
MEPFQLDGHPVPFAEGKGRDGCKGYAKERQGFYDVLAGAHGYDSDDGLPNPDTSRVECIHIQGIRAAGAVVDLNTLITQKMGALGSPEG